MSGTSISEQVRELCAGAVEVISAEELEKKLELGRPLNIKAGFDPTAPDLHLGHTVILQRMRRFQRAGHKVVFLIGDYTGMIGDPTGKVKTRPALTREEVLANAETYKQQVFKVLDPALTEVRFNSEWFSSMTFAEAIERLASRWTVARMLERDDFEKRYRENRPIALHEFLYPLVQGYDSVALKTDVELGGTDQKFNLLVGRGLQKSFGQKEQVVMTMPLLVGTDGVEKMSKSLGNYIAISEGPGEQFGKIMSISDPTMWAYYELLSDLSIAELAARKAEVAAGTLHPKRAKVLLAQEIVGRYHGSAAAEHAAQEFDRIHAQRETPEDLRVETLSLPDGRIVLLDVLEKLALIPTRSQGRRLAAQGALRLDGEKVEDPMLVLEAPRELLLQVGKRVFCRVILTPPA
ncbi:MAG TPA: tyrosine--tRNA ligase [Polyangiaceae bacterium]